MYLVWHHQICALCFSSELFIGWEITGIYLKEKDETYFKPSCVKQVNLFQ